MEDLISRQAVLDALYELCNTGENLIENPWRDNPHIDALVDAIEQLPSVNPQEQEPKTDVCKLLDKTFDDFCKCPSGEGWLEIDGKEYFTDVGYALEGMKIFIHVIKKRMIESEDKG